MTKLTPEDLEAIVARDLPGWRVRQGVPRASAAESRQGQADAATPDIDALRRKYLGTTTPPAVSADEEEREFGNTAGDDAEDVMVVVEPEAEPDAFHQGPGPKGVIISTREGRVIGSQG